MAAGHETRTRATRNPVAFAKEFFSEKISLPGQQAQMKEFHRDLLNSADKARRLLYLYPAGHGKTSLMAVIYPIYRLCKNPNIRITIVASDEDRAKDILSEIKGELEGNKDLLKVFGKFETKDSWAATQITIAQRKKNLKDPTIRAVGIGGAKQGPRADLVIFEDVADPKNSDNEAGRKMIARTLWYSVLRWMDNPDDFQIIATGTRVAFGDIYEDIIKKARLQESASSFVREADKWVVKVAQACNGSFEKVLWPEKFPKEFLMGERELDPIAFDQRFRNIVRSDEMMGFPEHAISEACDDSFSVGEVPEGFSVCLGVDLASGSRKRGTSFSAVVALASDGAGRRHVVDIWRGKEVASVVVDKIVEMYAAYGCREVRVEKNYQQAIIDILDLLAARHGLRIVRHATNRNKVDPAHGVESLRPILVGGNLTFPSKTQEDRRRMEPLLSELRTYPVGETTDLLMALWIADLSVRSEANVARVRQMNLPWYARRGA